MRTLAVIGAGAKGIAIAAKARALADTGFDPPRVVLVERAPRAAPWPGRQGYTDGSLPLGTPPEKDVGYPYPPSWGAASDAVTDAMMAYSWPRNLNAGGTYADWVDRGRQRPTHREWGAYLREVAVEGGAEPRGRPLPARAVRWRHARGGRGRRDRPWTAGHGAGPAGPSSARPGRPQLLAAPGPDGPPGAEHLCHRQRRDGRLGRDHPGQALPPALGHRRADQPRCPLLPWRELRREPFVLRSGRLAPAGRIAPPRVPRPHRPGCVLGPGRGDPQSAARVPHARRAGAAYRGRAAAGRGHRRLRGRPGARRL